MHAVCYSEKIEFSPDVNWREAAGVRYCCILHAIVNSSGIAYTKEGATRMMQRASAPTAHFSKDDLLSTRYFTKLGIPNPPSSLPSHEKLRYFAPWLASWVSRRALCRHYCQTRQAMPPGRVYMYLLVHFLRVVLHYTAVAAALFPCAFCFSCLCTAVSLREYGC